MKIVFVQGGLGNQLFQYAFFKYLLHKGHRHVYLDATAPFISKHGGFELKKVFPAVAANKLILPYWKARPIYLIGDVLKKIFKLNLQTNVENPTGTKIWWKAHWQEYQYSEQVIDELRNELQFAPITDEQNEKTIRQIAATNAVSIHLRRGDYRQPHIRPAFGDICTVGYYKQAIAYIQDKVADPQFFVFSDDPQWVRENLPVAGAIYVDWNKGKNNFRDLQLMSSCKHHIIANSSFSWWGAWLNPSNEKVVVAPTKWAHSYPPGFAEKLLPPSWHRIGETNPNISLIIEEQVPEQLLLPLLQQQYYDFELLTHASIDNERVKPASSKPSGNFIFTLTKNELPLFKDKKYLERKLINYFKTWNN